ncbi:probable aquaporin SIP2-1 isoform X2 [Nymphaea colorata]|uniref:probable aquaporin SIP2-1 isoform X2 n=1 Tax=Nymphaea colorata TaxID=210225 RepID=UPI00214F0A4A|nr:probable aquaporin SIP2-1 isoform X2 [Nymphaea colorata]
MAMEIRARLAAWDFGMSLMWAWSGALTRLLVHGFGDGTVAGEVVKVSLYVGSLFLSAWVGRVTGGGCGNPLTLLVCGSIVGAALVTLILPEFTYSDPLKVGIAQGALTEGFLAFGIASVSLALTRYDPNDFIVKTWIHSMSRLTLRILGSDLTGGIMNPASAAGWAFVLGNQTARQHLLVYWIAPIQATILAAWAFRWLIQNGRKQEKRPQFMVSVPIPRRLDSSSRILSRRTHKFQ